MRKITPFWQSVISVCIAMMFSMQAFSQTATPPALGDGSESNPYQIATLENLYWLTQNDTEWDKYFIQIAEIDASTSSSWDGGVGFIPIGHASIPFRGSYNGKGYIIDQISIISSSSQAGFFGMTNASAHIDSLGLTNANVVGERNIGSLVGYNAGGEITNCYTTGNCINNIDYIGSGKIGGLVGYNNGIIDSCYSYVIIRSASDYAGGLVGINDGNINQSYSAGNVTIGDYDDYIGGLAGTNSGIINNSYCTGNVKAGYEVDHVGGLVSTNNGVINNSYSIGNITHVNANYVGGLVGQNSSGGYVNESFWDIETSEQSTSQGGVGLNTSEMKGSCTFLDASWDFMDEINNGTGNYWGINSNENNGYPFLTWQGLTNTIQCQAPCSPASNIIFGRGTVVNSITLKSFTQSGYVTVGYSIYVNTENSWVVPPDGSEPIADTLWQNSGQQCIYFGTSNNPNVTVTGLLDSTKYYFKVYSYNDCSGIKTYEHEGTVASEYNYSSVITPLGDGSESNPFQIAILENLRWLSQSDTVWDKHFIQTADIDASSSINWNDGKGFSPIGNSTREFEGSYNGKGHIVDSIFINRPESELTGFFGSLYNNAHIDSLGLTNIDITGARASGGLVGFLYQSKLTNCYTTGKLINNISEQTSWALIGGLVGGVGRSKIEFCYSDVDINSKFDAVGGLVGDLNGEINNSYSLGSVTGNKNVGGLVGINGGAINNCYSKSKVIANNSGGGLVGALSDYYYSSATFCFWDKETSGQSTSAGGVGLITSEMQEIKTYLSAGWDFMDESYNGSNDKWGINISENNGYPFLQWQEYINIPLQCQVPFSPADSIVFGDIFTNSINLDSFAKSGYGTVGYCIYINTEDTWIVPVDGTKPTANTNWQNNGQQCIYFGTSNLPNVTVTGLSENTNYYFKVYAYNDCSGTETYEQTGTVKSQATKVLGVIPAGGGTKSNPYVISNLRNLVWLMYNEMEWDKYYIQTAEIDATESAGWDGENGFTPIGNSATPFSGSYDGKGFTINQLTIDRSADSLIGLFGNIEFDASIENIGLTNMNINGGRYVGGIAGRSYGGEIKNCYTTGICSGNANNLNWGVIGGIAGYNLGTIKYCYSDANVSSSYDIIGGLVGVNDGFISCSYSSGNVNGDDCAGGLVGLNYYIIYQCYSRSNVKGHSYCGGLVGDGDVFYVLSSFWDTETSGQSTSYGGVGLGTVNMQKPDDYVHATWDFMNETINGTADIWGLNAIENHGYPFLQWQGFTNTETVSTGINSIDENNIIIYPNPVSDFLNINLSNKYINRLVISDISGKIMLEKMITSETVLVDMSSFKPGMYLINVFKEKEEVYSGKIIKR